MKTLTFTYTKKDGSVSTRTLLAMVTPSDKYAGIDVSDMDAVEAADFIAATNSLHSRYLEAMQTLQSQFDLKHNYRQFLAGGMTNITEI